MKLQLAALASAASLILWSPSFAATADNDLQVRIPIEQTDQIEQLLMMGLDVVASGPTYIEILTNPAQLTSLQQLGFKSETVHESAGEFYRSRLPEKDMGGYKTLSEMYAYLDAMIADHPDIVSARQSIGTTIEGRDIWAVKISDNPSVDEDEPEVLYTAAIHCREVATPEVLLYFMDYLTNGYASNPDVQALVNDREIWLILLCNPDGYYYNEVNNPEGGGLWRRNRRNNGNGTYGVDLNRNFGYQWGYDNIGSSPVAGSETYRGTGPFSEPETQALRDFEIAHEFVLSVYYHSYANIFIFPWGYVQQNCPDNDLYRSMGDTINAMTGYQAGLVAELLYTANGGSFDWEYSEQTTKNKILGTTIEVGNNSDGFWPTLSRLQEIKEENLNPLLFLTRLAGHVNSLRPPTAPVIVDLPSSVSGEAYDVNWADTDPENPAVQYELVELQKKRIIADSAGSLYCWNSDGFSVSTARASSGIHSLFAGSDVGTVSRLQTTYPYLVKAGDHLTFHSYHALASYRDFAYVEVSTDERNFAPIPGNITSDFDPYGGNRGNGISGYSDTWVDADFDLAAFEGQQVWFRFSHEPVYATAGEGWYLDDIYPHIVFDDRSVVASNIAGPSYEFAGRPMGVYYYQVRSMDAAGQWSTFSDLAQTDVLGSGTGDLDLDGVSGSAADLALFSLFFKRGLPAFSIYPDVQIAETDINCDELILSSADLNALAEVVVGAASPCYTAAAPLVDEGRERQSSAQSDMAAASSPVYTVVLQNTLFPASDSVLVDLVLTDADAALLGYQFHLEYDATTLNLVEVRPGDAIASWQLFDFHATVAGSTGEIALASVAQYVGDDITADDIDLLPTPGRLARVKFTLVSPRAPLTTDISFVWDNCGDNAIVAGSFNGSNLEVDSLALSRSVLDPLGTDITALDPRHGGADPACFYGLFGNSPTTTIDFSNTRIVNEGSCCAGVVGDANREGGDDPTIGDVSMLIDHLFISGVELTCLEEADINQSGGLTPIDDDITIGDVSMLIDNLFISGTPLPACL